MSSDIQLSQNGMLSIGLNQHNQERNNQYKPQLNKKKLSNITQSNFDFRTQMYTQGMGLGTQKSNYPNNSRSTSNDQQDIEY